MKLRVGRRVFAPSAFATLLTAVTMAALISLGCWQLRRAEEKRALMTQAEQGRRQTLPLTSANIALLPRYQRIRVSGSFISEQQVLLDNMPSAQGQPGYRVLTPLRLDDGGLLLVDRGWLPLGADRRQRPMLAVGGEAREVIGLLDELPRPGVRAGEAGIVPGSWPQVLNYPTWPELQRLYGNALRQPLVLLDAQAADGYERHWQINVGFSPERHIGYAVQWFGLAATVLIIFVVVNLQRDDS